MKRYWLWIKQTLKKSLRIKAIRKTTPQPEKQSTSWKTNVLLLLFSLVICVLMLEIGIRTSDMLKGHGFFSNDRNFLSKKIPTVRPFRTFGVDLYKTKNGVKYISSSHGELFPIKKQDHTFRIIALGGSTTEMSFEINGKQINYPLVLQSELRKSLDTNAIEVINVGYRAYATPHSLILFELDALSWEPDMIIVSHNINDLLSAYWPNLTYDYSNQFSDEYYSIPYYGQMFTTSNILFQHSQLYWLIHDKIIKLNRKPTELRRKSYGPEPPQLAIEIFRRNLLSFVAIAKANGIKVLLGNQPLQPSEEYFIRHMGYKPFNSIVTYPLHEEFILHHRRFNEVIKQVAEETGVYFIDNDSKLGGKKEYFIDFVHYTPKGLELLGNNYAEFIIRNNICCLENKCKNISKQ